MLGCLDLGHQKGISQIEVDLVQLPTAENGHFAVCKATVISKTGDSFVDIGDANPGNCSSKVSKHLLRMASTEPLHGHSKLYQYRDDLPGGTIDLSDIAGNGSDGNTAKDLEAVRQTTQEPILRPKSLMQPLLHLPARSLTPVMVATEPSPARSLRSLRAPEPNPEADEDPEPISAYDE